MAYRGKYIPKNIIKYVGHDPSKVIYRSLWERHCMAYFDKSPNILEWSSESIIVPYFSPLDVNKPKIKPHRYYPDFYVKYKHKSGEIKEVVIEIKPKAQTAAPKEPKRKTKKYYQALKTFAVNTAKWNAAKKFCEYYDYTFLIWTEKEISRFSSK
jgi:hypothetical protein